MERMVRASRLGKKFGRNWAIRNLDFLLNPGQCLVVLGPNGSGKSTLLKLVAGLIEPNEGTIVFGDEKKPDLRTWVGYTGLDLALYSHLTVREHLEFAAELRGIESRWKELLTKVGLSKASEKFAQELSTGMRARLKLAMAIQSEPKLLLLDEPSASLDETGRELVETICNEQLQRGCLMIATNDPLERRFAHLELSLES